MDSVAILLFGSHATSNQPLRRELLSFWIPVHYCATIRHNELRPLTILHDVADTSPSSSPLLSSLVGATSLGSIVTLRPSQGHIPDLIASSPSWTISGCKAQTENTTCWCSKLLGLIWKICSTVTKPRCNKISSLSLIKSCSEPLFYTIAGWFTQASQ